MGEGDRTGEMTAEGDEGSSVERGRGDEEMVEGDEVGMRG